MADTLCVKHSASPVEVEDMEENNVILRQWFCGGAHHCSFRGLSLTVVPQHQSSGGCCIEHFYVSFEYLCRTGTQDFSHVRNFFLPVFLMMTVTFLCKEDIPKKILSTNLLACEFVS